MCLFNVNIQVGIGKGASSEGIEVIRSRLYLEKETSTPGMDSGREAGNVNRGLIGKASTAKLWSHLNTEKKFQYI